MALTDDREYGCQNPDEFLDILAGAADTLYKGAIVSVGANGFIKVPGDVAVEQPIGVMRKRVVAAGANAEHCIIDVGRLRLKKVTQHVCTVLCTDQDGGGNAAYANKYFFLYDGNNKHYVWFNVAAGGVDPAPAGGGTGIEVAIGAADHDTVVADKLAAVLDALEWTAPNPGAATVTITADFRGYSLPTANGNLGAVVTITNTILSGAQQADVGILFRSKEDDGVCYQSEAATATMQIGRCVGLCQGAWAGDYLIIDTRDIANT